MRSRVIALLCALTITGRVAVAAPGPLPIYIEDNHAGTFYWLAQHVNLDEPCSLIHFDAHSDASGIFDSDKIRAALRTVSSAEERAELLQQWRRQGAIQCFNWIEPLMPAPIARVVWVPADHATASWTEEQTREATALLDGHLQAAPRRSGPLRDRYAASDLAHLADKIRTDEALIVTIDLDYFADIPESQQAVAFARVWDFVVRQENLRAVTFAISRPYLRDDNEADRLLGIALEAARLLPTARLQFEPFASVAHDRSRRARDLQAAGHPLPAYDISRASQHLRSIILAEAGRLVVEQDPARWTSLLREWQNETAQLHLELKDRQPSTDGICRIPVNERTALQIVPEPWTAKMESIEWCALEPAHVSCNVSGLTPNQVGFVAQAAPRPEWKVRAITTTESTLPIEKLDALFDASTHAGSVRLRARATVDGMLRETPVIEVRRLAGSGFRAAVTEQFGLPYIFGSGELSNRSSTGAETNLGSDCANFLIYAMRRQGMRVPWCDPKQLRRHLELVAASTNPGASRLSPNELERGLLVHLGTHVAAVMEDRSPVGVLDENDLVAHQLNGFPEVLALGELLRRRRTSVFDLYRLPASETATALTFGGDVMLGRSCAGKITNGIDPFGGIRDVLARSAFVAANLECTISRHAELRSTKKYSFYAPARSAALLHDSGFRAVSLANNHALDFGEAALRQCAQILAQRNVEAVGAATASGDPYAARVFDLPGCGKLALVAICDLPEGRDSTVHPPWREPSNSSIADAHDRARLATAIADARAQAGMVVCLVHWGIENTSQVTDEQRALARWLIEQGVDVVVGSHPHCVQSLDFYHGRPVAYSLGNLVFDGARSVPTWNRGALLQVKLSDDARVQSSELIPVILESGFPRIIEPAESVLAKQ